MSARRTSIGQGSTSDAGGALGPALGLNSSVTVAADKVSTMTVRESSARGDQVNATSSATRLRSSSA